MKRTIVFLLFAALAIAGAALAGIKPSQNGTVQTVESGTTLNIAGTLQLAGTAVTASAAELNIVDGVTATAAEITASADGVSSSLTFAAAAGGTNVSEVTVTVKDGSGGTVASVHNFDLWLSDAATCEGLTGTTASGAVAAKSASGTDLTAYTAKKALRVQTLATGIYVLSITDTAKTGFYVCGQVPGTGKSVASAQLVAGNYG